MQGMIFHRESWKAIYFWIKRSKVKVMTQKSAGVGHRILVGFFWYLLYALSEVPHGGLSQHRRPYTQSVTVRSVSVQSCNFSDDDDYDSNARRGC